MAQAETIPAQLGIMRRRLRHMLQAIPLSRTGSEGDVLVCNDPYLRLHPHPGHRAVLAGLRRGQASSPSPSTIAHHIDIGGKVPGTEAADSLEIFEEGLILPPLKLVEARPAEPSHLRHLRRQRARPQGLRGRPACPDRRLPHRRAPRRRSWPKIRRRALRRRVGGGASTMPRPTCAGSLAAMVTARPRPRC